MAHLCLRCGASCQGLKVRLAPAEQAAIAPLAAQLGVERPFSGPYLRQNWGTCVFYDQGCRLHAAFGAQAKPSACRQFPEIDGTDPSCFHPGDQRSSEPWPEWQDLSHGLAVRQWLVELPLAAVLKPARLGTLTVEAQTGLDTAEPVVPAALHQLDGLARQASSLTPRHERRLWVGGGQLLAGKRSGGAFAAWVRFLRTTPSLRNGL